MFLFMTLDPHPPTAYPLLGQSHKKSGFLLSVCWSRNFLGPQIIMKWPDMASPICFICFRTFLDVCWTNNWICVFIKKFRTFDSHRRVVLDKVLKIPVYFFWCLIMLIRHGERLEEERRANWRAHVHRSDAWGGFLHCLVWFDLSLFSPFLLFLH